MVNPGTKAMYDRFLPLKIFFLKNRVFLCGTMLFAVSALAYAFFRPDTVEQFRPIGELRTPWLDKTFALFSHLSEEEIFVFGFFSFLFVRYRWAIAVPLIGLVGLGISDLLKSFFSLPRPYWVLFQSQRLHELRFAEGIAPLQSHTDSFPSGHTLTAFALYGFLSFLADRPGWKAVCLLCAVSVALSRVWLVHHYPRDVGAGAMGGLLLALLFWWGHQLLDNDPGKWWNGRISIRKS
jgi:membrane-associated phospholipid phosphatase